MHGSLPLRCNRQPGSIAKENELSTRRQWLRAVAVSGALPLAACGSQAAYEQAARATWHLPQTLPVETAAVRRELVRCATLAPSSHNTQCWKFRVGERGIDILADLSRRCPVVDPDDHHLYVSLGCAAENLVLAAAHHGLHAEARFAPATGIRVALEATAASTSPLYAAIAQRQSTRGDYDGRPLAADELRLLEAAGSGRGTHVMLLTAKPAMEQVLEQVVAGNTVQLKDKAFVDELKAWIRFNGDEAVRRGDGLYAASSGNPTAPRWLGTHLFDWFATAEGENDKYRRQIRSSAGLAVFFSDADDAAHWVEVGRCCERFALQAAALDIRTAYVNQPVEVAALRPQLAALLGIGTRRPDLVVRFGRGPRLPVSLRRPLAAVIDGI
jgi:hypothetical protein